MRALFLVLLLANAAFFAWSRYWMLAQPAEAPAPTRQVQPEKLKIVPPAELAALPPRAPRTAPPAGTLEGACLEWGSFTVADYQGAQKALEPLALDGRVAQRRTEEVAHWWVFIPPQGSRQGALRKASELKSLGVDDYFVIAEDGDWRWSLSLGVYRSEEAAHARLEALHAQGVRSAVVGPRETVVPKIWLQVRGVDPVLEARLAEIARQTEGSELRPCP